MKVTVIHHDKNVTSGKKKIIDSFLKFIYDEHPLDDDLTIFFLPKRVGKMTTGARTEDNSIKVLTKSRITRDILRTLAHEWIHCYQREVLGRDRGPDIGGLNENEANALAGSLIKKFEKKFPNFEQTMYE